MPKKEDKEDLSNSVCAHDAEKLEEKAKLDARIEALGRVWCVAFGMNEDRWRSFEIDAKKHIVAHDHLTTT